ncbi:MAG: class I SAM-dependent methyltransferase [Candidatus Micrarchaeia archaeon]
MQVAWDKFNNDVKPLVAGKKLLDLGCGNGSNILRFGGQGSLGVDYSKEAVAAAMKNGLRAVEGSATTFRSSEKFQVVTAFHLLEHMETKKEVAGVLKTAYEALEPGGLLIVKTPYAYDTGAWIVWDHVRVFTMESMRQWLELSGFEIVDSYTFWHFPFDPFIVTHFGQIKLKRIKRDYVLKLLGTFNLVRDLVYVVRKPIGERKSSGAMPHYGHI